MAPEYHGTPAQQTGLTPFALALGRATTVRLTSKARLVLGASGQIDAKTHQAERGIAGSRRKGFIAIAPGDVIELDLDRDGDPMGPHMTQEHEVARRHVDE
jgi:hypothetical protein